MNKISKTIDRSIIMDRNITSHNKIKNSKLRRDNINYCTLAYGVYKDTTMLHMKKLKCRNDPDIKKHFSKNQSTKQNPSISKRQ